MYKLFLCLQYLRKRALAYFAMAGVALCVFVMLICVSVLTGFVRKIERAAKGLFGDVVVSSASLGGFPHYDEFIAEMKRDVPAVEGASPFILTFGILQVPGTDYRRTVQVAGIRLPDRAEVSDFEEGLFVQAGVERPTFEPDMDLLLRRLAEEYNATREILERASADEPGGQVPREQMALADRIRNALRYQEVAISQVRSAAQNARDLRRVRKELAAADEAGDDDEVERLERLAGAIERMVILPPARRVILGLGIPGLTSRTPRGETVRTIGPGQQVVLSLIPLGRRLSYTDITPTTASLTVIDDCSTDVSSIDSEIVYVPFETLQALNNMGPAAGAGSDANELAEPPRCSQVHVKVKAPYGRGYALQEAAREIDRAWVGFQQRHPEAARAGVIVETWRQRQSRLVSQIESQRTLMVIILGVISFVAVLLIFVIMYVVVVQKTRDIGVLKAVGASSAGVAGIFLGYGGAIGLLGSLLGSSAGYLFVRNINPIHDWVGRTFGFVVWSRETFMFEKIPNDVDAATVVTIVVGAVLSGVFGSVFPALVAAWKQPVEALRYE